MFEQFGNYRDIKWHACAAGQAIGMNDKIQTSPNLELFRLEYFKDLRRQPGIDKTRTYEIMLIDNRSKTNIFIDGPDNLIDRMIERLPYYKDKTWVEIQNMNLEKDTLTCQNVFSELCDPWISDNFEMKPLIPGKEIPELDIEKADQICAECKNYKFKGM